jgi:GAF domain-containing protein
MSPHPALGEGLTELSLFFVGNETMLDTLLRIAELCVEAIESAAFASVTMLIDDTLGTGVATDPVAAVIDRSQYEVGNGPALEVYRTGEIQRVTSTVKDGPWPAFRAACRANEIMSATSFPLLIDGVGHGALNVYSNDYFGFGVPDIRTGRSFAEQAGAVIAYARTTQTHISCRTSKRQ